MEAVQKRMKEAVDGLLDDLDKNYLRGIQKKMFDCSSRCCDDRKGSRDSLEKCVDRCNSSMQNAQRVLEKELGAFQASLSLPCCLSI